MESPARPHLHVVNPGTGEIETNCEECRRKDSEIAGLTRDVRGWMFRYAELKRDRATEAEEHPCWDAAKWTFNYWRRTCKHPKARWSHDRFWLVVPFLEHDKWGKTLRARIALCVLAIDGARYDAWTVSRKNGSVKRFDEFDRIFATTNSFEDFCKRAPTAAQERCAARRTNRQDQRGPADEVQGSHSSA